MKSLGSLKEVNLIILSIILLSLVFGFNDNKTIFTLSGWLTNLFFVFILVTITILVNVLGYKLAAKYYEVEVKIKLWNSQKFQNADNLAKKFLLLFKTPILSLVIMLLSNGKIYFTPLLTFSNENLKKFGRNFPNVTYYNIAMISFLGLLFNLILMWMFSIFNVDLGVKIQFWFILFNLLPFSEFIGAKILSGSVTFYIFTLIFFLVNIFLIGNIATIASLFIALLFSVVISTMYFYLFQYMKS